MSVEARHPVLDEVEHRSTGLESKSGDELFTWFEPPIVKLLIWYCLPWEWYIEFFSFLAAHPGCDIEDLVSILGADEVVEEHDLEDTFSVHLRREQWIGVLDGLHSVVKIVIVTDNTDASVDAGLDLDGSKAEHGQGCSGSAVALGSFERLSHILQNIDVMLLQEGHNGLDIVLDTEEVSE